MILAPEEPPENTNQ